MDCPLTNALFGILGVLIGGFIGNRFALGRERASRKRDFLAYMHGWRAEVKQRLPLETPDARIGFVQCYAVRVRDCQREASLILKDLTKARRGTFEQLMAVAYGLSGDDAQTKDGSERILAAVEEVISYVDAA